MIMPAPVAAPPTPYTTRPRGRSQNRLKKKARIETNQCNVLADTYASVQFTDGFLQPSRESALAWECQEIESAWICMGL